MRVIDDCLIGENSLENRVLQKMIEHTLWLVGISGEPEVGDPDRTGMMELKVEREGISHVCKTWVSVLPDDWRPGSGTFDRGEFDISFRWRIHGCEGDFHELDEIFRRNDEELVA